MLYNFLYPLADQIGFFNLFKYITVRSGGALGTAFFITLFAGPWIIQKFRIMQAQVQTVKQIAHPGQTLSSKAGTPSMGGVMIIGSLVISSLLWADITNTYIWLLLSIVITFGLIGFVDDYLSMAKIWNNGVPGRIRLAIQTIVSAFIVYTIVKLGGPQATDVYVPFFKDVVFELSLVAFIIFGVFVIVGSANAVNLTDGLDGLVSVPAVVVAGAFAGVSYIVGRADFTEYLNITYVAGASEVTVFCSALVGSVLGFLWYNAPPARIFMGDTGALPIGAALGAVSVILKQEFLLAIIGGLFVLETVSVIVQVTSFKLTGKRIFKMAPLHHHFEHKGWAESTIVVRFWIIAILLAMVGLATLKLR